MKAFSFAIMMLLALALRAEAQTVVNDPFPPAHLTSLFIEWDQAGGKATSVRLDGDAITYKVESDGKVIENDTIHPTDDDWFKFIQGLNTAKVYNWAPKYEYPGQGDNWAIELSMADRNFSSGGSNDFPKEGDESQPDANPASGPSIPFQVFWQAVLTLVGKAPATAQH